MYILITYNALPNKELHSRYTQINANANTYSKAVPPCLSSSVPWTPSLPSWNLKSCSRTLMTVVVNARSSALPRVEFMTRRRGLAGSVPSFLLPAICIHVYIYMYVCMYVSFPSRFAPLVAVIVGDVCTWMFVCTWTLQYIY